MKTFFSGNTNSDVGSLDHTDIVGTISDSETHDSKVVLDQANDLSLLQGRDSAADDGVALR